MIRKIRQQNGFTLIELLIVVAIIGILSAIAIPQYQDYIKASSTTTCEFEVNDYKKTVDIYISTGKTYKKPTIPADYEGACSSVSITINQMEASILATYKKPENPVVTAYLVVRSSDGNWREINMSP